MKGTREALEYWMTLVMADLTVSFSDVPRVKEKMYALVDAGLLEYFIIQPKDGIFPAGMFCYMITDDLLGGQVMAEVMFYILPEYRGSLRLVRRFIDEAERIAREKSCNSIKIGANIRFKDASFIKLLKRWGYVDDAVCKYLA